MAEGTRRSLTKEEHALRLKFDAAPRDAIDGSRRRLWRALTEARGSGALAQQRLAVKVHLRDSSERIALCLIANLRIVLGIANASMGTAAQRVEAYAPCELLFGGEVPVCDRPGRCPHDVVVYAMESDNNSSDLERRGWEALVQSAGREHKPSQP